MFLQTSIDANLRLSVKLQVADFSRPIVCQVDTGFDGEILIRCLELFYSMIPRGKPKPKIRYTKQVTQLDGSKIDAYVIRQDVLFGDSGNLPSYVEILSKEAADKWDGYDALIGQRFLYRYRMLLELQSDVFELTSTKSTDMELSASKAQIAASPIPTR